MKHNNIESVTQQYCVAWFRSAYPDLRNLLFAVPNGGKRGAVTGAIMKAEGVTPGVADLLLLVPNSTRHGLCIEMKTETGRQQDTQKQWQAEVEAQGYQYSVCRSVQDFQHTVWNYFAQ